jgi:hypothetical protein
MRDPIKRIFTLLACARVSASELERFLSYVRRESPHNVFAQYQNTIFQIEEAPERNRISELSKNESDLQLFDSLRRDIDSLLRNSPLTRAMAARQIARELIATNATSNERALRFVPKDGFESWLRKALNVVGGSALLRATSIVVNRHLNRPKSDWPLTSS